MAENLKTLLIKCLLLFLSTLAAICIAEGILRLTGYHYTPVHIQLGDAAREKLEKNPGDLRLQHAFESDAFIHDPHLIWRPKKGVGIFNDQGYRGRDMTDYKMPGTCRIFALGDSNTLGWDGFQGANWPLDLEDLIREAGADVIVGNGGVWGYSLYQGRRRFDEILALKPDMVLISFGANDAHLVHISDAEFTRTALSTSMPFLSRWRAGQLLLAFWDKRVRRLKTVPDQLVHRVGLDDYRQYLEEMIGISKKRRIACVLLTRPFIGETTKRHWWKKFAPAYNKATLFMADRHGIPAVDIHAHFNDKPQYFYDESHFTPEGHRAAARVILQDILPILAARGVLSEDQKLRLEKGPAAPPRIEIDFGTRRDRDHLLSGFSRSAFRAGRTMAWSDRAVSEVQFDMAPLQTDYSLILEGRAHDAASPLEVQITVNGIRAGVLRFDSAWQSRSIKLPRALLNQGRNNIRFKYSKTVKPADIQRGSKDQRDLALLFDRLGLSAIEHYPSR
jgi:lysophospholipase L1-like esterase